MKRFIFPLAIVLWCVCIVVAFADDATAEFAPYALEVSGQTYTVQAPADATTVRVTTPDGRTIGLKVADSSVTLDAAALATLLATPQTPAAVVLPSWHDATTGYDIAIDADSQAKFTADVSGYSAKALSGSLDLDNETTVLRDATGTEHLLTIRAYLQLLGRLHDALRSQWAGN